MKRKAVCNKRDALIFANLQIIYLTVSSRKDLSITPWYYRGFSFHMQSISRGEILWCKTINCCYEPGL